VRRSDSEAIEAAIEEEPEDAVRMCEALLEDDDGDADIWCYLAEAQLAAGRPKKALDVLAQVVELDPEWVEAYTLRAEILIDLGRLDAADIEIEVAVDLDRDDPRVLRARALRAEIDGRYREADKLYAKAEDSDPLWPAPPRFDRDRVGAQLREALDVDAVRLLEMPSGGPSRLRMVDLDDPLVPCLYLRNLERELDGASELEDLVLLIEEAIEDAGPVES
jgi:tetratricopeptide (TPR) repeat protein